LEAEFAFRRLSAAISTGSPLVITGVGSGLTAKGAVAGGADGLAVYNTAVYRIQGLRTALAFLPFVNANALTMRVAPEIVSNAGNLPVLLGLGAHRLNR
jgi:predicted TIM-barrel enzyme